jgi:hypothetical protein
MKKIRYSSMTEFFQKPKQSLISRGLKIGPIDMRKIRYSSMTGFFQKPKQSLISRGLKIGPI